MAGLENKYDAKFYANQKCKSRVSAARVIALIKPILGDVKSIVDIGCGAGGWLAEFAEAFDDIAVQGVDHPGVPRESLFIDPDDFMGWDLSSTIDLKRRYDVAMSLEVAEHIDEANADKFVENLTRHADIVLFSAAVPRQGGTGHVNERWPNYWIRRFEARGYILRDVVRPLIWDENEVASWYQQNTFLFEKPKSGLNTDELSDWGGRAMVHPGMWMRKTEPVKSMIERFFSGQKPDHSWKQ